MSVSPARRAAFEVVRRVFEDERVRGPRAAQRERGASTARARVRATARLRNRAARADLDHAIDTLGRRPVRKLDPPVLAALRLGAYQLGYLDVAPHAAANESVELVRAARLERAVPFTNAVMRRLAEGIAAAARRAAGGAAQALVPGLDLRDVACATSARTKRSS